MKTPNAFSTTFKTETNRHVPQRFVATALIILGLCCIVSWPSSGAETPEPEVLTRGPVHEAFAGVVAFNPAAGIIVPKAPPAPIEEVPPDAKPAGDNVTWIPGYWAWDDERNDFLWVSGVWRALPPGRQWVTGYWTKTSTGYQWISGYWADAHATDATYLPPPPATLETGPNIDPPSPDYIWSPGCWVWYDTRYAWQPGYWVLGRPDWDWCPAYYTWTPRGYVYVDGYWDYAVGYRGVLFAPVYFNGGYYAQPGYYYAPSVAINLTVFPDHLFCRPHYNFCYFGDFYAVNYYRAGYYPSYTYQYRRYGYDPIYAQRRWEHRQDHNWEKQVATTYQYRRDNAGARPPRTWSAQSKLTATAQANDSALMVATSFDQLAKRHDNPVPFQPVAQTEKQQILRRDTEVRQSREDRRTLESTTGEIPIIKGTHSIQPTVGKLPKSPIASVEQPERAPNQPAPTHAPSPTFNVVPKRDNPTYAPTVIRGGGRPDQAPPEVQQHPDSDQAVTRDNRPTMNQAPQRETLPIVQPPVPAPQRPPEVPRPAQPGMPLHVQPQRYVQPTQVQPQPQQPTQQAAPPPQQSTPQTTDRPDAAPSQDRSHGNPQSDSRDDRRGQQ